MKINILFIFFLIQILYCDDITIYFDPIEQYGTKTFSASSSDVGSLIFLDISKFKNGDKIFYYFKFNKKDAYKKTYSGSSTSSRHRTSTYHYYVNFFEAFVNEIDSNYENLYLSYVNDLYSKNYKTTKTSGSKATIYFSTKKNNDYKYLLIALYTSRSGFNHDYTFKNTEKDESGATETVIIIIIVFVLLIIIIIILVLICHIRRKNKKKTNAAVEMQGQQGEYIQQNQYDQPVQVYSQQSQYPQQPQYDQQQYPQQQYVQPQNPQQGYAPMNNDVGYTSKG